VLYITAAFFASSAFVFLLAGSAKIQPWAKVELEGSTPEESDEKQSVLTVQKP
jgi:hypothetical protein